MKKEQFIEIVALLGEMSAYATGVGLSDTPDEYSRNINKQMDAHQRIIEIMKSILE